MTRSTLRCSRREALGLSAVGLLAPGAFAAGARVDPDSATARALGYRPDGSATVRPDTSQRCEACVHFAGGVEWAPCAIFQGCKVNAGGWCRAFTAR